MAPLKQHDDAPTQLTRSAETDCECNDTPTECSTSQGQTRKPRRKPRPCSILALSSVVMFGLYYLIGLPASVRQHLKEVMPQQGFEAKYQLLFTFAHFPGIFLPAIFGVVVDLIGGRTCILLLSSICFVGQVVSSRGIQVERWTTALIGRFVYGIGFESLFVANQAFLAEWFDEQQLGMALGVSSAASYIGYLLSFVLSPIAANDINVAFSFWLGAIIMGVAVLASLVIFVICRETREKATTNESSGEQLHAVDSYDRTSNMESMRQDSGIESACDQLHTTEPSEVTDEESTRLESEACCLLRLKSFLQKFGLAFWLLCISCCLHYAIVVPFISTASGLLLERDLFMPPPDDCNLAFPDQCTDGELAPSSGNPSTNAVTGDECPQEDKYAPVIPTHLNLTGDSSWDTSQYVFSSLERSNIDCSNDFWSEACTSNYCDQQADATEMAGILMTVPFIVTVTTTFFFGHFLVDQGGLRAEMIICAPVLNAVAHALFAFSRSTSPITPLVIMGFGYSLSVSALWPSVVLTAPEDAAGAAFGLMTAVQNVGHALWPILVAAIYNVNHTYLPAVEIFFLCTALVAVMVAVALYYVDRQNGGALASRGVVHSSPSMVIRANSILSDASPTTSARVVPMTLTNNAKQTESSQGLALSN